MLLNGGSPGQQALIKSAAALDPQANLKVTTAFAAAGIGQDRPWYEQERHAQHDEPAGGASTSNVLPAAKQRDRVKFAGGEEAAVASAGLHQLTDDEHGGSTPVAVVTRAGFFSFTRPKLSDEGAASANGQGSGEASLSGSARKQQLAGGVSRANSHTAAGQHRVGFDASASGGSGHHGQKFAGSEAGSQPQSGAASRSQSVVAPSGMSATLKGLFGGASSKLLGSIMGRASGSSKSDAEAEEQEELWFTSLDDFKPICHMLHRGRYMTAYFACANKTGQHFLLKKFDKHKMLPAEERGVRRAIAFAELLQHPNLVRMKGTWESDDIIFVVEEYVGKGDILNDCISHPEKYTERHVAVYLTKPLLQALAHLHANNIIHRTVLPENAYMGLDDVLRLGHLCLAIDQTSDRPKSRTTLLDYMAPEMISIRPHNEHELALLDDDSEDGSSSSSSGGNGGSQQQQQQWESLHDSHDAQQHVPPSQLGLLGHAGPVPPTAAAVKALNDAALLLEASADGHHHGQHGQQHTRQRQHSKWMQEPAQLDPSRQASLDPAAFEQLEQAAHAEDGLQDTAAEAEAAADPLMAVRAGRSGSRAFLGPCSGTGMAGWEYQDHYDEKVDIWQLGCMLHELLCGSMPFELDSKVESAGLSLWADIEVLPGSVAPDCADFIQQALIKDPQLRPSAEQLLQHPWLARCQAGEPWREPQELEAARREAELATFTGWIRQHWAAAAATASGWVQHWQRSGRVAPLQPAQSPGPRHSSDGDAHAAAGHSRAHSSTGYAGAGSKPQEVQHE